MIHGPDGKATAVISFIAYVADAGASERPRPVTFAFNGGPGVPSSALNFLAFGPRSAELDLPVDPLKSQGPPTVLRDNPFSLLDRSDLVFIDAIGTGFSRPLGVAKAQDFYAIDEDIQAFFEAVRNWLAQNTRTGSPVALLGESYGGERVAGLADELPKHGVQLDGVVLLSPGLESSSTDLYSETYFSSLLPTFAAVAWYHHRLGPKYSDLRALVEQARAFATGPYLSAIAKGDAIPDTERSAVARTFSSLTGLAPDYIERVRLRMNFNQFSAELLRGRDVTNGVLDGRQTGFSTVAAPQSVRLVTSLPVTYNQCLRRLEKTLSVTVRDGTNTRGRGGGRARALSQRRARTPRRRTD